ncbi:MAG: tripartite tricarboxylate transporter substrate binding protein [Xanthobacteraceae bacterium]
MTRLGILVTCLLCLLSGSAPAQTAGKYPSHSVKIIVPYAPGGATDIVARILANQLSKSLGQSFYVENRPGAFGIVADQDLARSPADGYTLMIGNVTTNAITPVIYPNKLQIDYAKEVVPVTELVDIPAFLLATKKNFDVTSVPALIAFAKKNPGRLRYGTVGPGSYPHYDMAYFAKRAGNLDMVAIPNKAGASGVINDMLNGSTEVAFLNVASSAPQIKAGNFVPLALVDHARLPDYPNLPTMQEIGFPGVGTIAWQALFAPGGTPKDVLQTVFDAFVAAMKAPDVAAAFKEQTFNVVPSASLADAKTWLAQQMATWRKITSEVKIQTQ